MAETSARVEGRRGRPGQDPDIRRAQLMNAARHCFAKLGFEGTTVDKIAAQAGVSVGLLYRFYKSKAAIIEAIVIEDTEAQFQALAEAIEADGLGSIGAAELVQSSFSNAALDPDRIVLMFEIAAAVHRNPELRNFVQRRRAELKQSLLDRLAEKGLKVEVAASLLGRLDMASAIASGVAMQAIVHGEGSLEHALDQVSTLITATLADR
jgi:AcrR family transcriptional regulator